MSEPKVLLLDECFAALDVLTIKMLQETVKITTNKNHHMYMWHQTRDLLACVDMAMILSDGKVVAQNTPANLVKILMLRMLTLESFKFN